MKILITGGAGYIGSHAAYKLIKSGNTITILDNLEKGHNSTLETIKKSAGDFEFIKADLRDIKQIRNTLKNKSFDCVIHFAAYIEVGRSSKEPEIFFENNVVGSSNLFQVLIENKIKNVIFSSSAAVYKPKNELLKETDELKAESPYGVTKILMEQTLETLCKFRGLNAVALRYFNPAGSFEGILGERHVPETHLIPRLLRSVVNPEFKFSVFGNDYNTPDGTCIRDYIHIDDLINAHIVCLDYLNNTSGFSVFNVGTGKGISVKEVINTAEVVTDQKINFSLSKRRKGDADILVADPSKFIEMTKWKAKYSIKEIIKSSWDWEQKRPFTDYK